MNHLQPTNNELTKWDPSPRPVNYQPEMSISDIWRILVKRKYPILAFALLGLALSATYIHFKTPIYQATAAVQIDPSRVTTLGLTDSNQGGYTDEDELLQTDIEILGSNAIAAAALQALPPEEQHEFTRSNLDLSHIDRLSSAQQNDLLGRVKSSLKCKRVQGTQIIQVAYRDPNRRLAQDLANNVVDAFLKGAFQSRYKSVEQVSSWFWEQMKGLKDQSADAQRKLSAFQETNNILIDSGTDVSSNTTIDKLKAISDQLTTAQADRITKESRYRVASSGNPNLLSSLVPDAALDALQGQHAQAFAKYAELSSRFGPGYPPVQEAKSEIDKINTQIDDEVKTLAQRLEKDYMAAAQTESTLRNLYDQQTQEAYALNRKTAEYALLKDQGDSSRNLYNILQTKLAQAGVNAGLGSVNAIIMDKAVLPSFPVEPQKPLTLALGLIMGLVTGVCSAFLSAANESNVESIDQIEAVLGIPTLALVPQFTKQELSRSDASILPSAEQSYAVALRLPRSRAAESYRTLRNAVLLNALDETLKTITFTSALPGEGKSTTAVNFAIVLAQKGSRVLLIDADLRRPSLSRIFKLRTLPGLSTCLISEQPQEVVITPINSIPNLSFIPAGPLLPSPSEALGSKRFFEYLERWRTEYDYIILDSAPILGISDSIPLASWSDSVLLVAHFGTTPIKALQRARDVLARANARIQGCILNGANWASRDYYLDTYSKGYKGYYV